MPKKNSTKKPNTEELDAFAHHLSEVLRIARTHPDLTSRLYNGLADAWNEFINDMPSLARYQESAEYIRLALRTTVEQRAGEEGGEG